MPRWFSYKYSPNRIIIISYETFFSDRLCATFMIVVDNIIKGAAPAKHQSAEKQNQMRNRCYLLLLLLLSSSLLSLLLLSSSSSSSLIVFVRSSRCVKYILLYKYTADERCTRFVVCRVAAAVRGAFRAFV